ncbi:MAG: hypothetical protein FJ333_07960 [Sphingomonadales bacterium]|nr:hypothetical protein [Sphingomonadales bacterium]
MKLKLSKFKVLQTKQEYLGHLVSEKGIDMVPSYVQKIVDWPLPQTGKQLKQFLGFVGYNEVKWSALAEEKFNRLKERFRAAPIRGYPDYSSPAPFILDTDFSKTNQATILSQEQEGVERFLGAGARKCIAAEQNYPSHEGELAAAVWVMRKFEHNLRFKPFILHTHSRCMQFLNSLKEVRGIYTRWLNFMQGLEFTVVHLPGVTSDSGAGHQQAHANRCRY